jgi:hypothetical protein
MTADPDPPQFTFRDPAGKVVGAGKLEDLLAYLPGSRARKDAEALIRDAAIAIGRIESVNVRADAVIERERQVEEREQALREDAIRRFCDGVLELEHRLDAFEQAQARAALDALPDPDHPQGLSRAQQADDGDLEAPIAPSHNFDKQQLEAMLARDREADDADDAGPGDLPPELDLPAQSGNFVAPEDPAGTGTRSVATGPSADARWRRRHNEPRPRKGKDWPAQPIAISLNAESDS